MNFVPNIYWKIRTVSTNSATTCPARLGNDARVLHQNQTRKKGNLYSAYFECLHAFNENQFNFSGVHMRQLFDGMPGGVPPGI